MPRTLWPVGSVPLFGCQTAIGGTGILPVAEQAHGRDGLYTQRRDAFDTHKGSLYLHAWETFRRAKRYILAVPIAATSGPAGGRNLQFSALGFGGAMHNSSNTHRPLQRAWQPTPPKRLRRLEATHPTIRHWPLFLKPACRQAGLKSAACSLLPLLCAFVVK